MAEARLVNNGMNPFEVSEADRLYGREIDECHHWVDIKIDAGEGGYGGPIFKIKEERYQ